MNNRRYYTCTLHSGATAKSKVIYTCRIKALSEDGARLLFTDMFRWKLPNGYLTIGNGLNKVGKLFPSIYLMDDEDEDEGEYYDEEYYEDDDYEDEDEYYDEEDEDWE